MPRCCCTAAGMECVAQRAQDYLLDVPDVKWMATVVAKFILWDGLHGAAE